MRKIVIVGNGPSVLDETKGSLIDSYDVVIRINDYQTKGFEEHVGTKTDVWALETKTLSRWEEFKDRFDIPELWLLISNCFSESIEPVMKLAKSLREDMFISPIAKAHELRNKIAAHPSTGAYTIYTAMHQFHDPIHIIGFDHWQYEPKKEELNALGSYMAPWEELKHNAEKEKIWVDRLIEGGRLQ